MKEKFSLKDHLFNSEKVAFLAETISKVYPEFESSRFQKEVVDAFPVLELKQRIAHIRDCLKKHLPTDYTEAVAIILKALPPPLDETLTDNDFGNFIHAPYSDFVAHYGCSREHLGFSLSALKEITKRFTCEDAIRYFINAFPKETMALLTEWSSDNNYHVRRLCSEGTRPKLPWSQKINIDVAETLPILNQLYADRTRYVTRSVANHLNDIAKSRPDLALKTLKNWQKSQKQTDAEMAFITKHALRTLVKEGHNEALFLLGFGNSDNILISNLAYDNSVKIGTALSFSFTLTAQEGKNVVIDYIVYFQSKQGTLSNRKVFKLKSFDIAANVPMMITKNHVFRSDMTTRQLYRGLHRLEIQINGTVLDSFEFDLV